MTQTTSLQPITVEEKELRELADSYKSLVVTPQTLTEVDKARKVLKNKRLEIENTVKGNKKSIKELIDKHVMEAERLVAIISPIEQRLLKEQKDLEEKQASEARAKIEAEENRKRTIRGKITQIELLTSNVRKSDKKEQLQSIEDTFWSELGEFDYQEFSEEAKSVQDVFHSALESRLAYLKEQENKVVEVSKVEEAKVEVEENSNGNTRTSSLIDLGFKKEPHAWVKDNETIPHSIVNSIPDDAWDALLKSKVKQSAPTVETQYGNPNANEAKGDDMNIFIWQTYKFGIGKNVPFKKSIQIKAAIEEIMKG
jgi:prophage DNA circulation protein